MGFFDDLLKNVDKSLKAIEDGALEKRLNTVADRLDTASKRTEQVIAKAADKPADALKTVEQKKEQVEAKAHEVKQGISKSVDVIRKKD